MSNNLTYKLIRVEGDVEPEIVFSGSTYEAVMDEARRIRREDDSEFKDGLYWLLIDWDSQDVEVGSFGGGEIAPEFQEEEEEEEEEDDE